MRNAQALPDGWQLQQSREPADVKLTVDGNEVLFEPLTAKGLRWIKEERGVDCRDDTEYAAYWKGTDAWSRERTDEFPEAVCEMLRDGLVLDWSEVPPKVRAKAGSPLLLLLGLIGSN
jgi:hypothetical protein